MPPSLSPFLQLKEIDIIEKLEKMCDPEETDGAWVSNYDITEKNGKLVLEDHGVDGHCKVECQTIAKACDNLLGEHDTDIAEELYKARGGTFPTLRMPYISPLFLVALIIPAAPAMSRKR